MSIIQLQSGQFGLLSRDGTMVIPFSEIDEETGLPEHIIGRFENYGKGRDNDLFELVKKEGLENEYCLIFMNKVCFHSTSLEEIQKHEKDHSIAFVRYGSI